MDNRAEVTIERLRPRIAPLLAGLDAESQAVFWARVAVYFPAAFDRLLQLYGTQYDFFYHLEQILSAVAQSYAQRSADLRALDQRREADPRWFFSERMVGGVLYVDLFADTLTGVRQKLDYFKELGLTYVHLMPLYAVPPISDGGYAVSSYREVNPALGTMDDLRDLAEAFRAEGISLVLDFVFNHTSDEHDWALRALAGEVEYQRYFLMFPDRTLPDQYERHLREIFPEQAPGSFTYRPEIDRWVWTTFNTFQWDLNYANPAVFAAMLGEMLFLANVGVEFLRLDAVPFVWKKLGTPSENLPEAHVIIQAFAALVKIAAPAMEFKSEAIVHPDDVASYFGLGEWVGKECRVSYNPTLMALLWESLATREVRLLSYSMRQRFAVPDGCIWINYVRVHDDIGWSFADEDARLLGMQPFDHRQFLNAFYTGAFSGSFASGLLFNYNPLTKDGRISGTGASLAGLERALADNNAREIDLAIRRIVLLHSVILSAGGIPLVYLGDEIATTNDYSFENDPLRADDNRWAHRPRFDWERAARRSDPTTVEGQVFGQLRRLIELRKSHPIFGGNRAEFIETGNPHLLGYIHWHEGRGLLALANFSEHPLEIEMARFRVYGFDVRLRDLVSAAPVNLMHRYSFAPYQFIWLVE